MNIQINQNENLIKEYYEKNKRIFSEPEKRSIDYILLNSENYFNLFSINENEIKDYYKNNISLYTEEEKRSFVQLNFDKESEAFNFYNKLKINKLDKNKLIKLANENDIKLNKVNFIKSNETLEEISNIVFKLNVNELSKIITSPLAFHIVFLENIKKEKVNSYESSKNNIIKSLKEFKSIEFIEDTVEKIDEDIFNGLNLTDISEKYSLDINKLSEISKNLKKLLKS